MIQTGIIKGIVYDGNGFEHNEKVRGFQNPFYCKQWFLLFVAMKWEWTENIVGPLSGLTLTGDFLLYVLHLIIVQYLVPLILKYQMALWGFM